LKKAIAILVVAAALSGCKQEIPAEARFCGKALGVYLSMFHQNLEVTKLTPPVRSADGRTSVSVAGGNVSGTEQISAICELSGSGDNLHFSKWWVTAQGRGPVLDHVELQWSEDEKIYADRKFPWTIGLAFKIDGYSEETYGIEWFPHE
jgi:hypothetical protein